MRNLNLLFYKEYYQKLGTGEFKADVERLDRILINTRFEERDYSPSKIAQKDCVFILKTTYPGLLIGAGNPHGAGDIGGSDDDINMGFSFEYVTGQPYIPGSSVKGVLRSHFKDHPEAVREIISKLENMDVSEETVKKLEQAIFDNADVFLDAVVFDGDEYGRLLDFDYITPHSKATKNPIPIKFIKVLPDVRFEFRFVLSDKLIDGQSFTKEVLAELFKELLCIFGAGAKTNVGYGCFDAADNTRVPKLDAAKLSDNSNNHTQNNNIQNSPKVKCPHCGYNNFEYKKDRKTKNKYCFKCNKALYK